MSHCWALLTLLCLYLPTVSSRRIDEELFRFKDALFSGPDTGGSCSNQQRTAITRFLDESVQLSEAALRALGRYRTAEDIDRNNAAAYLGLDFDPTTHEPVNPAQFAEVEDFFRQVHDWLVVPAAGPNLPQGPIHNRHLKPWLFCSGQWLRIQNPIWPAKTAQGQLASDIEGRFVSVRDDPELPQAIAAYQATHEETLLPHWDIYWSADTLSYFVNNVDKETNFDQYTGVTHRRDVVCGADTKLLGSTIDIMKERTVTLCTRSFGAEYGSDSLGQRRPRRNTPLTVLSSRSMTLFHELFHLVFGTENTPDHIITPQGKEELYGPEKCREKKLANPGTVIYKAPDCLTMFALASWYSDPLQPYRQMGWNFDTGKSERP